MSWDTRLGKAAAGGWILSALADKPKTTKKEGMSLIALLAWMGIVAIVVATILAGCSNEPAWAEGITTEASYYTVSSCIAESGQCTMANGRILDDTQATCASWDYKFGQRLRITNQRNNRSVLVEVTDRGPNRKLYKKGRKIDLSKKAFESIASLKEGIINVMVEVI